MRKRGSFVGRAGSSIASTTRLCTSPMRHRTRSEDKSRDRCAASRSGWREFPANRSMFRPGVPHRTSARQTLVPQALARVSHARGSAPPYRPLETRATSTSRPKAEQEPRHSPLGDPRWRRRVRDRGPRPSGRSPAVKAQAKVKANVLELEQPDGQADPDFWCEACTLRSSQED